MAKPRIYKDGAYWVGEFGLNEQVVGLEWAYVVAYLKTWYQAMAATQRWGEYLDRIRHGEA